MCRAGVHVGWWKNGEVGRRRGKDKARFVVEGDVVGVGVATKAVAGDFKAVTEREIPCHQGDFEGAYRRFCGGEHRRRDAAGTTFDRGIELFRIEWGNKKTPPGGIGLELVAIREFDGNARGEAPADVEDREGSAFAADDFAGQEKNAGR